jgi:hypothetical protein
VASYHHRYQVTTTRPKESFRRIHVTRLKQMSGAMRYGSFLMRAAQVKPEVLREPFC